MAQPKSKYAPIWEALKAKGECKITAPAVYHKTIIKMVKNRRDDDLAYRLELSERNLTHTISSNITGTVIHFTLTTKKTLSGI